MLAFLCDWGGGGCCLSLLIPTPRRTTSNRSVYVLRRDNSSFGPSVAWLLSSCRSIQMEASNFRPVSSYSTSAVSTNDLAVVFVATHYESQKVAFPDHWTQSLNSFCYVVIKYRHTEGRGIDDDSQELRLNMYVNKGRNPYALSSHSTNIHTVIVFRCPRSNVKMTLSYLVARYYAAFVPWTHSTVKSWHLSQPSFPCWECRIRNRTWLDLYCRRGASA
jgi:hypothetical protein